MKEIVLSYRITSVIELLGSENKSEWNQIMETEGNSSLVNKSAYYYYHQLVFGNPG